MDQKPNYAIPLSIVIAGCMIALAIYFKGAPQKQPEIIPVANFMQTSQNDHYLGADPKTAKVLIVTYSDLECPFCKIFHRSVVPLVASSTNISLIYRHYPIDSNHKQARAEAEYAACLGQTAGNNAYWNFVNSVFETTKSNDGLDLKTMPDLATKAGADPKAIDACVAAGTGKTIVNADEKTGSASGLKGTPFVIAYDKSAGKAISLMESNPEALTNPILKTFTQRLFSNWDKEYVRYGEEQRPNKAK
jgi:protein-disulfide isomerase